MLSPIVVSLARTLRSSSSESTLRDAAQLAALLFEARRGNPRSPTSLPDTFGFAEDDLRAPISNEDVAELTTALIDRICRPLSGGISSSLVWALGTSDDPRVKSAMIELLSRFLDADDNALYQVMRALDDLDEDVFRRDATSIHEVELNRARARAYLADRSD